MKVFDSLFGILQQLGRALMLPIAVMPAAGLLLATGAAKFSIFPEVVSQTMEIAGGAVFGFLPLMFAIGVALGFTKNDGVAALAAGLAFAVMVSALGLFAQLMGDTDLLVQKAGTLNIKSLDTGVFGGILCGVMASLLYNRFHRIELPTYLGFFGGKRFIPIVSSFSAIFLALALSIVWPPIGHAINDFSLWASESNPTLAFGLYGFVERMLIPFGLHHIWNVPFFFQVGSYTVPATGEVITGEIQRYIAGDPTAGNLAGAYLFKMWGLPGAAIAIWHSAKPENRVLVGGIMMSAALTSFITGITEPIEFAFLFVAPLLYLLHALMSSAAFVFCIEWGIKHGTTFSHGLFDYLILFKQSHNALWLLVVGPLWAVLYYVVFRFAITKFNLMTPGREDVPLSDEPGETTTDQRAHDLVEAFGGKDNIHTLDACITRLRVGVNDIKRCNQEKLKALGASGVVVVGNNLQAIFGPASENLKTDMEHYMAGAGLPTQVASSGVVTSATGHLSEEEARRVPTLIKQLGGKHNIKRVDAFAATRLRLELDNPNQVDEAELQKLGVKGVMLAARDTLHLIVGNKAGAFALALNEELTK